MVRRIEWILLAASLVSACETNLPAPLPADASGDLATDVSAEAAADGASEVGADLGTDTALEVGADIGTEPPPDAAPDASPDVAVDSPMDTVDAASDAPLDARDAALDVSVDAGADVALDARDAASVDAAADSPDVRDAAPVDAGPPGRELWLLRVGNGVAALTNAATPLFIDRRSAGDGSMRGAEIALPVAMAGANFPVTISGTATSEGALTRSVDGRFVTLAGYGAAPGLAAIASTASSMVPRVVARVGVDGVVDSSTGLGMAYSANNVRGAVTTDGNAFWVSGTGTIAGIQYKLRGAAGEPVNVVSVPSNVRVANIFGGQLYGSTAVGTPAPGFYGVFRAGTGTPTAADQTATVLPGFPAVAGVSAYGFTLLDRDAAVAGLDTLYLADDRSVASGGGVLRWRLSAGGTWAQDAVFNQGLTSGVRGLTAWVEGSDALIAVVTGESASRVVVYRDVAGMMPGLPFVVATAPTNTQFRGVALAPAVTP